MTITLPDEIRDELERKAKASRFKSLDDYVLYLIASDEEVDESEGHGAPIPERLIVKDRDDLEAKLLEGLNSGPPIPVTPEYWNDLERRVQRRVAARKTNP